MSAPIASSSRASLVYLARAYSPPCPHVPFTLRTSIRYSSSRRGAVLSNPGSSNIVLSVNDQRYNSGATVHKPHMGSHGRYNADLASIFRSLENTQAAVQMHKVKSVRIRYVHYAPAPSATPREHQPRSLHYRPNRRGQLEFVQRILPSLIWKNPEVVFDVGGLPVIRVQDAFKKGRKRAGAQKGTTDPMAEDSAVKGEGTTTREPLSSQLAERTSQAGEALQEPASEAASTQAAETKTDASADSPTDSTSESKKERVAKKAEPAPALTEIEAFEASSFQLTMLDGSTVQVPFEPAARSEDILRDLMRIVDPEWKPVLEAPAAVTKKLAIEAPEKASDPAATQGAQSSTKPKARLQTS